MYHLKRPNPPNPNLQLALHALNTINLNTLPPASSSWFSPEEEQLLCHADGVAGEVVAADVCSQTCKCNTADDRLVWLVGAVAPSVVVVKAAARWISLVHIAYYWCDRNPTQPSTSQ